jgi:hypothetical protein
MALDLWFREDVARLLAALAAAGDLHGPEYHKALAGVALAFGVHVVSAGAAAPIGDHRRADLWRRVEAARGEVVLYDNRR